MRLSIHDRIDIAEKFLEHFYGKNIFVSKFDPPVVNGHDLTEIDKKPWHYHDDFSSCLEKLINVNNPVKARGIFFCVNELDKFKDKDKKRTNKMWVRSRAIWCEDDNVRSDDPNDFRTDWPIVPNLVVNTSPGKFHYYWITSTNDSDSWASVQGTMVQKYGSDNAAKDLARVLRLPGFFHLKDTEKPHFINYVELRKEPYKWEEILKAFPPEDFSNTSKVINKDIEKAKRNRIFIRDNKVLEVLSDRGLIKDQIEPGTWDIICPWVKFHTGEDDTGTRFLQAFYNGHDQDNFKCHHKHCADKTIVDLLEILHIEDVIKIPKYLDNKIKAIVLTRPEFPVDFMDSWPEPWPLIWENWKRIPRELSQPLLTPTAIAFHAYMLNSKYITEWGRRPNLYQLNLAESTANKDTNSKDVLRTLGNIMIEAGFLNTIFNENLFNSDTNITSDTAFLRMLDNNGGKFFWLNTEATRVFQQINNSHGSNSAVMALSDKIIEVVDGHGITAKSKADNKIKGCSDPNVQVVFYAQPETIEKYINEEIVDSGFLGRAIITLDDKDLIGNKPKMFIRKTQHNKEIDDELAKFYASRTISSTMKEVFIAAPDEHGMEELINWSENFIHPMLEQNITENSAMHKMISRIGNTAEQLYAVILGVCREWDINKNKEPRKPSDISPSCMFPILEFWTKSKEYVVHEYIHIETDPLAHAIESILLKIIKGKMKVEKSYEEIVRNRGLVPRSILIRSMRNQGRLVRKMGLKTDQFMVRVNMTIDTMVANDILREEMLAKPDRLVKSKRTKFLGFA